MAESREYNVDDDNDDDNDEIFSKLQFGIGHYIGTSPRHSSVKRGIVKGQKIVWK